MTPHWHARAVNDSPARDLGALFDRCSAGDVRARETIIMRFLPLARKLARLYEGRGEPIEDLCQAASVGLIKAVDRYSPDRGDAFPAYAQPMILGEIRRHFRDTTWRLHVPRPMRERAGRVLSAQRELTAGSVSPARPEAVANYLGIPPSEVAEARRALGAYRPESLDVTYPTPDGDDTSIGDAIGAQDSGYEDADVSVGVQRALLTLTPRDRRVVWMRLGYDLTQDEIASRIGLSQMHVSRILRTAGAVLTTCCGLTMSREWVKSRHPARSLPQHS
ncbi:MAG TPA: sigma-70 family RNA polymerase sigma factor [Solirubrobacteraceae bacterium]|nr:sigma-70 family RNA polymerase sigma factor [Solirubrobacteraceae bacterium]